MQIQDLFRDFDIFGEAAIDGASDGFPLPAQHKFPSDAAGAFAAGIPGILRDNPVSDTPLRHAWADPFDDTCKFMPKHHWIKRREHLSLVEVYVSPADPGGLDADEDIAISNLWNRHVHQFCGPRRHQSQCFHTYNPPFCERHRRGYETGGVCFRR